MKYNLGLLLFSSKKGAGSSKNGRDSAGRRLGAKAAAGQIINAGSIIYRQRGTKIHPGKNVKRSKDDTLYATITGVVKFKNTGRLRCGSHGSARKIVSVYPVN